MCHQIKNWESAATCNNPFLNVCLVAFLIREQNKQLGLNTAAKGKRESFSLYTYTFQGPKANYE